MKLCKKCNFIMSDAKTECPKCKSKDLAKVDLEHGEK